MKSESNRLKFFLLCLVLILAFSVRLYKVNSSLTDWFSWRQTDTAAVGRFLQRNNFNLLKPQYYDLSNIQSGLDNPQGLRLVEFPIYNSVFAFFAQAFSFFSFEVWARLTTILFSLLIIISLYYLLSLEFGLVEAFFGSLFFALSPFIVFYSRTVLPDMPATALTTLAILFACLYSYRQKWPWLMLSTLSFALALLVKPTVIFFSFSLFYFLLRKKQSSLAKTLSILFVSFFAFVPLALWRFYIQQFPEGVPVSEWLLTSVNTAQGLQSIFFRPAFFRWLFFERISQLILGGYLVFFLLLGVLFKPKKNRATVLTFILSGLSYLFVFQGGNVQHEYYQIIITPILAVLVGVGVGNYLKPQKKSGYLIVKTLVVLVIFTFSFLFSYYQVKPKYDEQPNLVLIADVVQSLTQPKDLIVTDSQGDTTLLYLSDRRGFPAPYKEFDQLKEIGAKYFVTQNLDYTNKVDLFSSLIFQNDKVLIFKL